MTFKITRKGYWTVFTDDDVFISQHTEEKEAYESGANWSVANGGRVAKIKGADFEVVNSTRESVEPTTSSSSSTTPIITPTPPPDGGGFTEINLDAAYKVPSNATNAEIQSALDSHEIVAFPANAVYENASFRVNRRKQTIGTYGNGNRPRFIGTRDSNIFENDAREVDSWHWQGLNLYHPNPNRGDVCFRFRLSGKDGQYAKKLRFEDMEVEGGNTGFSIVDDWARTSGTGDGRIDTLEVYRCIAHRQYTPDASHSIPLYVEGIDLTEVQQTVFDMAGWHLPEHRNKRSHCIYAQSLGGPTNVTDSWLCRAAANAVQFRIGCRDFSRNVISECSLGPWITEEFGKIEDNVLLDQVDIIPPPEGSSVHPDSRGHGFMGGTGFRRNIAARRHGTMKNHPAYEGIWGDNEDNYAIQWSENGKNYRIGESTYREIGTNRTIDIDPGLPVVTGALINTLTSRRLGEWDEAVHSTAPFRKECWDIVQKYV